MNNSFYRSIVAHMSFFFLYIHLDCKDRKVGRECSIKMNSERIEINSTVQTRVTRVASCSLVGKANSLGLANHIWNGIILRTLTSSGARNTTVKLSRRS